DVDLPAALGNHFTPESLEALDVQAIQAKLDDIAEHLGAIDEAICKVSKKWRPDRMASCDRTILRLGVYDLCYAPEKADTALIINEAVELAKIYGDEDAYKFVNGVLDAIAKTRETV
ncbi:MAG: transcription antitermination factor NusB, partial [Peptococcus niger]